MVDQYFTPTHIANDTFIGLQKKNDQVVADFAIGDGALMKALPFKPKKVIGLDLDKRVVQKLRKENPTWNLSVGNLLTPESSTLEWLNKWCNKVDLVVLNPPFSCRGSQHLKVHIGSCILKCRVALAFVVHALRYLKYNGSLIAIIPLSCLKSELDLKVLNAVRKNWSIEFGSKFERDSFEGCFPRSVVMIVKPKEVVNNQEKLESKIEFAYKFKVEIIRGSTQMHKTESRGLYKVIHTTSIQRGKLSKHGFKRSDIKKKFVEGAFLFIPRVGLPDKSKIVLISVNECYVLSDCCICLRGSDVEQTLLIKQILLDNWSAFKLLYDSTCAPYITVAQLSNFLEGHKIETGIVESFTLKFKS